jgi:hypothetical protein
VKRAGAACEERRSRQKVRCVRTRGRRRRKGGPGKDVLRLECGKRRGSRRRRTPVLRCGCRPEVRVLAWAKCGTDWDWGASGQARPRAPQHDDPHLHALDHRHHGRHCPCLAPFVLSLSSIQTICGLVQPTVSMRSPPPLAAFTSARRHCARLYIGHTRPPPSTTHRGAAHHVVLRLRFEPPT